MKISIILGTRPEIIKMSPGDKRMREAKRRLLYPAHRTALLL
jgi:UDP-N-acetylglucosamine 2-epimerase